MKPYRAWIAGAAAFAITLIVAHLRSTPYNNYVLLADALLHGHAWIAWPGAYIDALAYNGQHYVIEAPLPAILMIPAVLVWGTAANQTLLAAVLAGVAIGAAWRLCERYGVPAEITAWLCAFLLAGTDLLWCAMLGDVWFIAHVSAVCFTMLALVELAGKRRGWMVALWAACAVESRFSMLLAIPIYAYLLTRHGEHSVGHGEHSVCHGEHSVCHGEHSVCHGEQRVCHGERSAEGAQSNQRRNAGPSTAALRASAQDDRTAALRASAQDDRTAALRASAQDDRVRSAARVRTYGGFVAVFAGVAVLWVWYNAARWGTWYDIGYTTWYHNDQAGMPTGSPFRLMYLPYQLQSFFVQLPAFAGEFPWIKPGYSGVALTWTSPALLLALFARKPARLTVALWIAAVLTAAPSFIYYVNGFAQFGMRHALDFEPFLFALMALAARDRLQWLWRLLIAYSVAVGLWGCWYWNAFIRPGN